MKVAFSDSDLSKKSQSRMNVSIYFFMNYHNGTEPHRSNIKHLTPKPTEKYGNVMLASCNMTKNSIVSLLRILTCYVPQNGTEKWNTRKLINSWLSLATVVRFHGH